MTWKTKKLGEICDIKTGKKDVNQGNPFGKYPFFTCAREHTYSDQYSFDMEALLVAGNGDVGHVNYYKGKFEAYQRTYILSDFKDVSTKFLYLFLDGFLKETVSKQKLGNTMPYIKMGMLTEFEISLPPLPEQQRIIKNLDEVFEKIAKAKENTEKNLQNAKDLFISYLKDIFEKQGENWEEKNLGDDICDIEYGYTEKAKNNGDYRFVRITDTDENGRLTQEKKMYVNSFKGFEKYLLSEGDLLMARTGASAGNVLLFEGDEKSVFASYLIRMKFKKEIYSKLYWYFSKSKLYWDQVKMLSAGSAQPQFNGGALKQIFFPYPKSLDEQQSIVTKLDALSIETKKLEAIYKQKLADLEELKKSVLKKAFAGDL